MNNTKCSPEANPQTNSVPSVPLWQKNNMPEHEQKNCPNCHTDFECKSGDILNCQCETVMLKQEHRDYIFSQYEDCLCAHCMRLMRSEYNVLKFNAQMQKLTLGK